MRLLRPAATPSMASQPDRAGRPGASRANACVAPYGEQISANFNHINSCQSSEINLTIGYKASAPHPGNFGSMYPSFERKEVRSKWFRSISRRQTSQLPRWCDIPAAWAPQKTHAVFYFRCLRPKPPLSPCRRDDRAARSNAWVWARVDVGTVLFTLDHVVYLNGLVDTDFQQQTAQSLALEVKGVAKVVNSLGLSGGW